MNEKDVNPAGALLAKTQFIPKLVRRVNPTLLVDM